MLPRIRRLRLIHEQRIQWMALAAGLPGVVVSLAVLYYSGYPTRYQWTLGLLVVGCWLGFTSALRERVASPLRTLANLLEAMREGDYSIRARGARNQDSLGEVLQQVNAMAATLRAQRLGAMEATTLLRKVMEEIDVAIFAFDGKRRVRLVNRAGQKLLSQPSERLMNQTADEIGLSEFLEGEPTQTVQRHFAGGVGRWAISRSVFREGGLPHQLLVITDLTRPLREEELLAWQRLVRVLGHELNNSLTPIKSIAESLATLLTRNPRPDDWQEDTHRGLSIIAHRSEALSRFLGAYARLAKLPRPVLAPVDVDMWIRRVAALETRLTPELIPGPPVKIQGDHDQLEQLLINLLRNAVDATLPTGGQVSISWRKNGTLLEVRVLDQGPGISNTANLFVPFFTTKPGGSGIGLVLSRQIAEAHGGTLALRNRETESGCEACLTLPL
jgi:two-component system, NtrC family, nitrogen regulation sensor histidine kinase NtrY